MTVSQDVRADMVKAQGEAAKAAVLSDPDWVKVATETPLLLEKEQRDHARTRQALADAEAQLEAYRGEPGADLDDDGDDAGVCATHAGVAIIAPAGTKRHQLGRVGSRISGHLRDLNLWGTWTFTFQGRQRRTKR